MGAGGEVSRAAAPSRIGPGRQTAWAALLLAALAGSDPAAAATLRVVGSTTVNPVVAEAAEALRRDGGLAITVDTLGGSSGGLVALGEGRAELAMSSRPVDDGDRRRFPAVDFRPHPIGWDAVALVVSRDVWEGGVRSLTRAQVRGIYERRIRNWQEVGGPDRRVVFFAKEPGRGTWEVFGNWLYGGGERVPSVAHREVGSNAETRSKVASTRGAISQLSAAWVDGERVFALAVEGGAGRPVRPTAEAVASGDYPLARPLLVVSDGAPRADARALLDYLTGPAGQALVDRHGYLPLAVRRGGRAR